jgi:lipopolysaccharide/colanic/teichoic acid biosynthesis glycosyltransferase
MSPRDPSAIFVDDLPTMPSQPHVLHAVTLPERRQAVRTRPAAPSRACSAYDRIGKPAIDRVGAFVLLILLLPVLAVVALLVWRKLGAPLLYRQRRVGRDGRQFNMLKFRTMEPDRRKRHNPLPSHLDRRRHHKTDHDPRHTDLGRVLRRLSLDELPQLFNVIRGDMSLVGPRPELPSIVARYDGWQHQRHEVKPGITGLWQVTDRQSSAGDMHLHVDTDLEYLGRLSLRTDLGILLRTPLALSKGR